MHRCRPGGWPCVYNNVITVVQKYRTTVVVKTVLKFVTDVLYQITDRRVVILQQPVGFSEVIPIAARFLIYRCRKIPKLIAKLNIQFLSFRKSYLENDCNGLKSVIRVCNLPTRSNGVYKFQLIRTIIERVVAGKKRKKEK